MRYDINHPPTQLAVGDTVVFSLHETSLEYTAGKTRKSGLPYLRLPGNERNRKIFDMLDIEGQEVTEFAAQAYGYQPTGDKFPRAHANDMGALVRITFALFGKIATAPEPAAEIAAATAPGVNAAAIAALKALFTALTGQPFPD